jgi:Flp pilus assembly secretin CpaC
MGRATRISLTALAAVAILLGADPVAAASRANVGLNQSLRLSVGGSAANVVIGNPAIADVTVVDAHSVIILGKGYGATQIMVLDINGHLLMDTIVTVTAATEGQITLYRGAAPQQFSCAPRCEIDSTKSTTSAGQAN